MDLHDWNAGIRRLLLAAWAASAAVSAPGGPATPSNPVAAAPPALQLLFDRYPPDHVFGGESLVLPTGLTNRTDRPVEAVVRTWLAEYCPGEDGVPVDANERRLVLPPGAGLDVATTFRPPAAGPYEFRIMVTEADQPVCQAESTVLFNPDRWTLPELEPADFDAFWQANLRAARERPLEPIESAPVTKARIPEGFREVSFNGFGDRRIRGYFALPRGYRSGQRVPAILSLPSYGYHGAAIDAPAYSNGYAVLAISVHDLPFDDEGMDHVAEGRPAQAYPGLGRASKETFFYRAAYVAGPRAVDYLRSRPEVDGAKIVVTGFSQGGTLALATAALVPDVALVEAGLAGHSRMDLLTTTCRPNTTLDPLPGLTAEELLRRTLVYYDSSLFARRVRCPALARISLDDEVHPGPLQYWAFLQLKASPDARRMMAPWRQHLLPPDVDKVIPAMRAQYASPAT